MILEKSNGMQILGYLNTLYKLQFINDEQRDELSALTVKGICGNQHVWKVIEVKLKSLYTNECDKEKATLIQECLTLVE